MTVPGVTNLEFENVSNPPYSQFIHKTRYSRFNYDLGRRETWAETVDRLYQFWLGRFPNLKAELEEVKEAIYNLEVMPSMSSLMSAGVALERDHVAGYNCAYQAVTGRGKALDIMTQEMESMGFDEPIHIQLKNPIVFDEIFYILLCGTGDGFSVERQYVSNLPTVGKPLDRAIYRRTKKNFPGVDKDELSYFDKASNTIRVADSKYGWASSLRILIVELYNGNYDVKWDVSQVRPAGSILKTFGGRASGPEPLNELFSYCIDLFSGAHSRKLTSIEAHGLVCKIASVVVVGGVRRSALIGLSNLSDDRMRHAKSGDWWVSSPEYALANNSAVYTEKPDAATFMREWLALIESKSGERGIFNRTASVRQAAKNGRRDYNQNFGTNPCSEIILRDQQFCNLTEIVVRAVDTVEDLTRKARIASFLGTLQSTLTDFKYLNPQWKINTEEERLLGVSMTGIMDHMILNGTVDEHGWGDVEDLEDTLFDLKAEGVYTNKYWADKLGIPQSAATTCVKPSGTVSQLVDSASGIHARHSQYYLRSVRNDVKDPVSKVMIDSGFYHEIDVTNPNNYVFYFPIKAPEGAITRTDMSAIEQLELWLIYQKYWSEHKPSVTISVGDEEWMEVGAWVFEHFDEISGISFLPRWDHVYQQAPYQDLTLEQYEEWVKKTPTEIQWELLEKYESEDLTQGMQEYACSSGYCEI